MDLGQSDRGIELLLRCLRIAPQHSHSRVALGIAYLKLGDLPCPKEYATQALAAETSSPMALKNQGAILGREGDSQQALYYLRQSRSFPKPKWDFMTGTRSSSSQKGGCEQIDYGY